ncbi:MAG TPA: NAD(P)/FAD-dependent oxidoreductase [Thermoleophilaceae bacterium]|nr:NAD(P)/FAD-dependent oxidoreductase [Thermoleophilaceae bacterium]
MAWNILIAGGGFGGLFAARALERALPPHAARVTLVDDANFMLYSSLMPGAAGGTLEPRHVVVPLRRELRRTDIRLGRVIGADPGGRVLRILAPDPGSAPGGDTGDGTYELPYDHLIVALGSISRTAPVPGLAEHAVGFKTLADAIALRNRVLHTLEVAEGTDDPAERLAQLTYVFSGAGYAGVEALAELQDLAADALDRYPRCRLHGMRWIMVEARERVMGEVPAALSDFAVRELRARGIEVLTSTRLEEVGSDHVRLSTGETVPCRTVVWTAGVRAHPTVAELGLPLTDDGRIVVDDHLRVPGVEGAWAIGDAAAVPDPARPGQPCPPTAQHAMRQGRRVGENVAAALGSGHPRPFTYRTLGFFAELGRHQAVASVIGFKLRGFPAWFLTRTYHLLRIPGLGRKVRLVTDWTVGLLFGRDASELGQLGHPQPLGEGADPAVGVGAAEDGGQPER